MARKRSGDNYPLDVKGSMIFLGSIVIVPWETNNTLELRLGVVTKLTQKRGIDVDVFLDSIESSYPMMKFRVEKPSSQLVVVDKDQLKTMDKFHEAVRMKAALVSQYD